MKNGENGDQKGNRPADASDSDIAYTTHKRNAGSPEYSEKHDSLQIHEQLDILDVRCEIYLTVVGEYSNQQLTD